MAIFQQPFLSGGFPSMNRAAGAVGGWVELGRTTLGSAADTITVSSLADKRYYMVLGDYQASGLIQTAQLRVNGDSGTNYSYRGQDNGGTEYTGTTHTGFLHGVAQSSTPQFAVGYVANYSTKEKLMIAHGIGQNTAGAGNVPNRREQYSKWANTSNAITSFLANNAGTGDYNTGSELVILGWDPADTHTNNFWEELASVELGSANATIDSSTITAKKYLWIQTYITGSSANNRLHVRFNSDTSTYSDRYSHNGGADYTDVSSGSARVSNNNDTVPKFVNMFVINNSSNEKLGIAHEVSQNTAGAGNAPNRTESVFKWDETASQITSVQIINLSGTWNTGSILKVWGAD